MFNEESKISTQEKWDVEGGNPKTVSDDDALLLATGKVAASDLKRVYNFWTLCAYQVMIMCSWNCNIILYSTVFDLGGPMSFVYGTLVVALGQTLLMTSLAELCSIWPTAGGQQFYVLALARGSLRPLLSYLVGWAVLFGEIAVCASCALNSSSVIQSFVEITHPDFVWKSWLTWLVYSLFLLGPFLQNFFPRILPKMNILGAIWVFGGAIAWAGAFLALSEKQSAEFVFKVFINNSGYTSNGWVFIMSLYNPIFGLYGTDGILHLVEETENPSRVAPRAMVWSMVFCSLTSFASVLIMLFCAGNWESYLGQTQPYMNWFIDTIGGVYSGGIFCAILTMGINYFVLVGTLTSSSRLAFSLARDSALPFSPFFSKINSRLHIPLRAISLVVSLILVLGLIVLGSDLAFQAIVSCSNICIQLGYVIPIITLLVRGRKVLPSHPNFDLGRFGYAINIASVAWSILIITMLFFPLYMPVNIANLANMNWSVAVMGAVVIFPGAWWVWRARHVYIKEGSEIETGVDPQVVEGVAQVALEK